MQFIFGAGEAYGVPLTDSAGNTISNPTPVRMGVMQGASVDISGDLKELHGQYQFAMDAARGKGKIAAKLENAQISARAWNSLFFGQTVASGTLNAVYSDTTGALIPASPYSITPTIPGTGTWVEDLGVIDSNGVALTRVASAPATGQYSVAAGVYTFAAADTTKQVFISFRYTSTSAGAQSITVNNVAMGAAPTFKLMLSCQYKGKSSLVILPQVISTKLGLLSTKVDDHSIASLELGVYSNGVGTVMQIHTSE